MLLHELVVGTEQFRLFEHLHEAATFRLQLPHSMQGVLNPTFAQELNVSVDPRVSLSHASAAARCNRTAHIQM